MHEPAKSKAGGHIADSLRGSGGGGARWLEPVDEEVTGVRFYRSPLLAALGLPHGFSTRLGGVSVGPWASLNLDSGAVTSRAGLLSDEPGAQQLNLQRFLAAIGCAGCPVATAKQVHAADVLTFAAAPDVSAQPGCADGLTTASRNLVLAIRTADCVPILLADKNRQAVAAVHAGWRGVVSGVLPATITALSQRHHVDPSDLVVAIGPCIGLTHFEIGPEVADAFVQAGLGDAINNNLGPKPHADMSAALVTQLVRAGINPESIDRTDRCTFTHEAEFFSHRRDRGITGRLAAMIALPGNLT